MGVGRLASESDAYRKIRDELEKAELELRDQRERVAALRRSLPLDLAVEDQTFEELRDIFPDAGLGTEPPRSPPPRSEGRSNASPMSARSGSRQRTNVD